MKKELNYTLNLKDLFSKNMQNAVRETEKLDTRMSKVSEGKGMRNTIIGANLMTNALQTGGRALMDMETQSIKAFMKFEQFQTSLTTMFQGNRREAELLSGQLQTFAQKTPFELTEIQDATKLMLAYGSTSGGVVNELRMLGDISSGVGQPLGEIAYLYGTLRTQGRAYAMDIRQFAGRGIPIIEALAKQFKVSKAEVMDLVSKGKVGFPEVEKALKSLTAAGGQFNNMMAEQSKTLQGQVSNLSDAWKQLQVSIGESQSGILKTTAAWATGMVNDMNYAIAAQNKLEKSFTAGGGKQFTAEERAGAWQNPNSGFLANVKMSESIKGMVNSSSGNALQTANVELQLRKSLKSITDKYLSGQMGATEYGRTRSILREGLADIGINKLQIEKAKKATDEQQGAKTGAGASSSIGSATEVYGARPQNLVINITKLIENFTISTTNMSESTQKIKENVSKALLEAVNDVNQVVK